MAHSSPTTRKWQSQKDLALGFGWREGGFLWFYGISTGFNATSRSSRDAFSAYIIGCWGCGWRDLGVTLRAEPQSAGTPQDSSIFSDMSVSTSSSRRLYSSMIAFSVEKKSCCWCVDISMMFCVMKSSIASIETLAWMPAISA